MQLIPYLNDWCFKFFCIWKIDILKYNKCICFQTKAQININSEILLVKPKYNKQKICIIFLKMCEQF